MWVPEPYATAHGVRNECLQLMQRTGVQYVSTAALWSEIKLECIDASCTDTGGHAARPTEGFNEEGAGYQVEVSRLNTGVSTF